MKISSWKFWSKYDFLDLEARNTGGILALWNPETVHVITSEATQYCLSFVLHFIGSPYPILCTNVYGPQWINEKINFIQSLEALLKRYPTKKWILDSDFNIILSLEENKGGSRKLNRDSEGFQNIIDDMKLVDLETTNGMYTWAKKHGGNTWFLRGWTNY